MKQKIKAIYISNILEGYYTNYNALKSKSERDFWTMYDVLDSNRALLYGGDNKVVITSSPIHPTHFNDMNTLMGWEHTFNFSPQKYTHSISADCIKDKALFARIEEIIENNPGVAIIPYRLTTQFQKLVHFLKLKNLQFETPETIPEEKQFILNYFNTKRGFRHLWHVSGANNPPYVQIPEGFITQNKKEALDAAWWFKQRNESFVIKYNSGVQGIGVELIDHTTLPHDKKRFYPYMKHLLRDKMWNEPVIVVEKGIAPNEKAKSISPSLEIYINPKGIVSSSYACDQILASDKCTFRGIYIYPDLMKDPSIKKSFAAGIEFGKKLSSYGYRGVFDIDLIRSKNNEIFAVEANLRRNGGTHLHELCMSLLGKGYGRSYHTLIEDIVLKKNHQLSYESIRSLFGTHLYSPKKRAGIIFSNPDMLKVNILVIVVIGKSAQEIKKLRSLVDTKLGSIIINGNLASRDW